MDANLQRTIDVSLRHPITVNFNVSNLFLENFLYYAKFFLKKEKYNKNDSLL